MARERAGEDLFTRIFLKPKHRQVTQKEPVGRERRRWIRFSISDYAFTCRKKDIFGLLTLRRNIADTLSDISTGGVRFITREHLRKGHKVYIKIALDKFGDTIEAIGKVKWVRDIPKSIKSNRPAEYFIGAEFIKISDEDIKRIEHMRSWFTSPHSRITKGKE
ncbi:MAG: hypothetical protein A2W23_01165 [Planctomycetes bacterium RBG_16_43_13]|nr:MAG: hypothetical protein A2W23_01165 [Planctomycetes bacterium RBG_16_43_13]